MTDEAVDPWFSEHLFDAQNWYPERIGRRHIIFSRPSGATLFSMAIDPVAQLPGWRRLPGKSFTESLFIHLLPLVERDASIVFLTYPDGAWIEVHGSRQLESGSWTQWLLRFFEETPAEQGGGQMLVVLLEGRSGALVFERFDGLDIAYYGPDDLWKEIASALYGPGDTHPPCNASSHPAGA